LKLTAVADDSVLLLEAGDTEVEVPASPAVLEDVAFALGNHSDEPSSPVKLGAGLASLTPIRVSTDCGGVVGPVESTTIEVQVSTEVKSDSAWSDIGHNTGEEYTASPLRVIIFPPPHHTRPPILIIEGHFLGSNKSNINIVPQNAATAPAKNRLSLPSVWETPPNC